MGAKTPDQLKLRRPTVKCDICGRKFLNAQALKSHHAFLHSGAIQSNSKPINKSGEPEKLADRLIKKKLVPINMLQKVNSPTTTKTADKSAVDEKSTDLAGNQANISSKKANLSNKQANLSVKQSNISVKAGDANLIFQRNATKKQVNILSKSENAADIPKLKKAEFECPVCDARFPIYLSAFRHIQQNHCVNESGEKVTPTSPHLVKPIRIEECATCNAEIRSTERHNCPMKPAKKDQYTCFGCKQVFNGLVLFQQHIKGLHTDGALNYFFPTRDEFKTWKSDLENQTSLEYVKLNRLQTKEVYHCAYQPLPSKQTGSVHLCPSSFTVRNYSQGLHVYFYTEHYGHPHTPITVKHNQYSISSYFQGTDDLEDWKTAAEEDNELIHQLKNMVTCIVKDAVSIDSATLKKLIGKALEMTTILKEYEGEHNVPVVNKNLTDAQITTSLENSKADTPIPVKRKLSPATRGKKVEPKKVKKGSQSTGKLVEEENITTKITRSSPSINKSVTFKTTKKESESEDELQTSRALLQSPPSFVDTYKNFVDQNFKPVPYTSTPRVSRSKTKKKDIVKTKMGQFKNKPSTPPKLKESPKNAPKESLVDAEPTPKAWKKVPDIKYEVKEQENDCNILILKI